MIPKRIIPVFLLKGSRLVKGTGFRDHVDVGDPTSQAMIYDAQGADEIIIVDIEASKKKRMISASVINDMITKCRLPISAGGGIGSRSDAKKCFEAGADKIIINTHAALNPKLIKELSGEYGSQSVIVSIDIRKTVKGEYGVYIFSGTKSAEVRLEPFLETCVRYGAGEIMATLINTEGTLGGFDCGLFGRIRQIVPVPLIVSGGAGSYDDISELFKKTGCDACGIGKMLFLRDYDIVKIKSYLQGEKVLTREA